MGSSASAVGRVPLSLIPLNGDAPKILVLGCMGSGKSTLCRQLMSKAQARSARAARADTPACTDANQERSSKQSRVSLALHNEYYIHTLQHNLLEVWKALREVCEQLEVDVSRYAADFDVIYEFRHREDLSDKVYKSLKAIARSGLLEECQKKRRVLSLPCNYHYFVQHTDRILHHSYCPTEADILFSYAPTVGLFEIPIRIGFSRYELIELPGHHIWRKRWPSFFAQTAVLCFLVDLSELCQAAFYSGHLKDKTVGIFKELVQHPLLQDAGFLLLFNKKDTFDENSAGFDFRQLASHAPNLAQTVLVSLNKIFKSQRDAANTT
ncbi:unnamed protein product [Caenorhabditis auriculariae]|uniref:G domain-containing protein n=1 Tax=Caenorhabditis auriculariae TaxID=2777116 RepID=A0A8S1HKY1_9PELO|nr:unnamed protein product [Caenorhabditis auriculariae]